jgi:molecular chaperone GrpE
MSDPKTEPPVEPEAEVLQTGPAAQGPPPADGADEPHVAPPPVDAAPAEQDNQPDPVDEIDQEVDEAYQTMVDDLARLAAERQDYLDQLLRTRADFENYRKRILKQQTEHLERAAEGLVEKLLDVLDVFDAAMAHGQGFDQAYGKLLAVLEKEGLERIDPVGAPFDPNESDAVAHEEADGQTGPVVSEVLRAGYRWKGRVVRPAMVKVRG